MLHYLKEDTSSTTKRIAATTSICPFRVGNIAAAGPIFALKIFPVLLFFVTNSQEWIYAGPAALF